MGVGQPLIKQKAPACKRLNRKSAGLTILQSSVFSHAADMFPISKTTAKLTYNLTECFLRCQNNQIAGEYKRHAY